MYIGVAVSFNMCPYMYQNMDAHMYIIVLMHSVQLEHRNKVRV